MNQADYYYLSNDAIDLDSAAKGNVADTLIGIANPDFLHVLGAVAQADSKLRECVAFDNNPSQLEHFARLLDLVRVSADRFDFLERLLCVRLGQGARQALMTFSPARPWRLPGAGTGTGHVELERAVWSDSRFDAAAFQLQTGLKANVTDLGLRLQSEVVGGMDSYMLTVVCVDTAHFECTPFSVRFGYGFLSSDQAFLRFKALLSQVNPGRVMVDAASGLMELLLAHRYERLLLWLSNVFTPYFIERHPPLASTASEIKRLGTQVHGLPQLDLGVIADSRVPGPLSRLQMRNHWGRWRMTPHYKTFAEVRRWLLLGATQEIVNVPRWIEEDRGVSKLPGADYCLLDSFLGNGSSRQYDTVFLHILMGHGATEEQLLAAFEKARQYARRVLVLEHNSRSVDFLSHRNLPSLERIVDMLGTPSHIVPVAGVWSRKRNWLLVYDNPEVANVDGQT